jgi:hypothetical protein
MHSDDNSDKLIMRLRIKNIQDDEDNEKEWESRLKVGFITKGLNRLMSPRETFSLLFLMIWNDQFWTIESAKFMLKMVTVTLKTQKLSTKKYTI